MKIDNTRVDHAGAAFAGRVNLRRAGTAGPRVTKGAFADFLAPEIEFAGAAFVEETDDGVRVTVGLGAGGSGSGSGSGSAGTGGAGAGTYVGTPIRMLNNSGDDLAAGAVVVVDETVDDAVTTTTTPGDTRIVGVLQEDITAGAVGLVLFNGFSGGVITVGAVARGQYLQTSATAGAAEAVDDRGTGTFAVVTVGATVPSFAQSFAVTLSAGSVTSLAMDLPATPVPPVGRVLFLALYRDPSVTTAVTLTGWTRIGSTSGFWYYYRVATGSDDPTASWTTAAPALGIVLLLDPEVDAADIVEDFDYEATSSAAALTGLSSAPRYVLAAVQNAIGSTPADWALLASGTVSDLGGSTDLNLAHGTMTSGTNGGASAPADPTYANDGNAATYSQAPAGATGGTAPKRTWDADLGSAYSVDRFTLKTLQSGSTLDAWLAETPGAGVHWVRFQYSDDGSTYTDIAVTKIADDGNSPQTTTWEFDAGAISHRYWRIYLEGKYGNNFFEGISIYTWNITGSGTLRAEGSIVGRYIGLDAAVTSPFTGSDDAVDALFAINLTAESLCEALLYGPDLGGGAPAAHAASHENGGSDEIDVTGLTGVGGSVATDAIWDAAGDLAVGSGADTAARLALGAAGGRLSRINGVVAWDSGTANPTAAANDRFWRTDLGLEVFYDGTRWLSLQAFNIELTPNEGLQPYSASGALNRGLPPVWSGDIFLLATRTWFYVAGGTALSGSHKWVGAVQNAPAGTVYDTVNIDSGASDTHRQSGIVSIGALLGTTNFELECSWTKLGTPGALYTRTVVTCRLVVT